VIRHIVCVVLHVTCDLFLAGVPTRDITGRHAEVLHKGMPHSLSICLLNLNDTIEVSY